MKKYEKLQLLNAIFYMALILANILAGKIGNFFGFFMTIGIITYPITFAITDIISECWGKKEAQKTVYRGFLLNILVVLVIFIAVKIPSAPFYDQSAFVKVFSFVPRVIFASMISYLVSQTHDIWAFHFWKKKTKGKYLWIRNNASTMVSQLIDSILFIGIAFVGILPQQQLISMMVVQYVSKFIIAALDTPFVYLGRYWVNKKVI